MEKHVCAGRLTLAILAATLFAADRVVYHVASQSRAAGWVLALLRRVAPAMAPTVLPFSPNLNDARVLGRNLMYRIEGTLLVLAERLAGEWADMPLPASERPYRREWLHILCANLVHLGRESVEFIAFAEHAAEQGRFGPPGSAAVQVHFPTRLLGSFIAANYPTAVAGMSIRPSRTAHCLVDLLRIVPGRPGRWLELLPGRRKAPAAHVDPAAVAAGTVFEQAFDLSLRHFPTLGHLAWAGAGAVDRRRVVLYFDRSDTPATPEYTGKAEALGFGWADLAFPVSFLERPLRALVQVLRDCAVLFPRRVSERQVWRWATFVRHLLLHRGQMAAVTRFNVKMLHQCTELPGDVQTLALAVRKNGGLFLWNFWSFLGDPPARYYTAWADVCFAWGAHDEAFYYHIGLGQRAVFRTGILSSGGTPSPEMTGKAAGLRAAFPENAKVIAVFDTSFGPEVHNSRDHLIAFYGAILSLAGERPDLCLLVKSKGPNLARLGDPAVTAGLKGLEAEGRCLVLDSREPTQLAALAADLVVAIPVGTAAIAAAALGRRALHLDLSGMDLHPLRGLDPDRRIIVNDPAVFRQAIAAILDGDGRYGDHAPVLGVLDGFGDGGGSLRMGEAVASMLDALERGATPGDCVRQAAERHRARWGQDSVSFVAAEADRAMIDSWRSCLAEIAAAAQPAAWVRRADS